MGRKCKSMKKEKNKSHSRKRSSSGSNGMMNRRNSHHSRKSTESEEDYQNESVEETETDISEMDEQKDNEPVATVKTFDTLLKYILRQKGQYREGLLDVYANPQTHVLVVEAFSQMKQLQPAEQAFLWPALLRRWSKYTHRI